MVEYQISLKFELELWRPYQNKSSNEDKKQDSYFMGEIQRKYQVWLCSAQLVQFIFSMLPPDF
jgi:hypothetical protein